jgi:integrase
MGSRRGHGEGSIYQRQDGRWCAAVDLGYVNGKRKRKLIYGKTRKAVAEALKKALHDQQQGVPIAVERQTVEQFLGTWLDDKVKVNNRPKTYYSYKDIVRLHINPSLGHIQLSKVSPKHIQSLLSQKRNDGLSPRTVQYIRAILRMALAQAVKWGAVPRNAAALTDPPKVERYSTRPLTAEQGEMLLEAARDDRLEALYRVALSLGLRQGEVLGLRWQDIDFDARTLRIEVALQSVGGTLQLAPPKTANSRRTLPLPAALVTALEAHRIRQLEERLVAGKRWKEHGLVFPTSVGTPISPRNLVRSFKALLKRAYLPDIRFHDLRHSCASILAAQGVPPRVAMEILGHASITTTQNIYTHVFDDAKRQAADVMDHVFGRDTTSKIG